MSSPNGASVARGAGIYIHAYERDGTLRHTLQIDSGLAQESSLFEPDPFTSYGLPVYQPPVIGSFFATHSHFDHIGNTLGVLHNFARNGHEPFFLSPEAYAVLPILLADGLSVSLGDKQIGDRDFDKEMAFLRTAFPGFDADEGIVCPGAKKKGPVNFVILNNGESAPFGPAGEFTVTAYRANGREHLPGTNYYVFDFGGTKIATLLDVGLELTYDPQTDLAAQPWLRQIAGCNGLIMEGTTADRVENLGPREERERALSADLLETLKTYDLVVYPAFAQDRSGDLLKQIKQTLEDAGLGRDKVEIIFAAPLAKELMQTFNSPYGDCLSLLEGTIQDPAWNFSNNRKEGKKYVVIATAGFGDYPTPSYFQLEEALALEEGAIRLTSTFAPEHSEVDRIRKIPDLPEGKVRTTSLTGHPPSGRDYDYLAQLAAPKPGGAYELVHGDFLALWAMQRNLIERAGPHKLLKPAYYKEGRGIVVPAAKGTGDRAICLADPYTSLIIGPDGYVGRVLRDREVLSVRNLARRHPG
ncbi:MAG: hypothetical protein V1820_00125 [archaeon]